MTDAFITIKPGRVTQTEGDFCTVPGVYQVGLVEISDPFEFTPKTGVNAGKPQQRIAWLFAVEGGDHDGELIEHRTSTATGPKSAMFGLLTALFGGQAPPIGAKLNKPDLIGRSALMTLVQNGEYLNVDNISALPVQMQQQRFAQATGAPTQGTPVQPPPPAAPVAPADAAQAADALPF